MSATERFMQSFPDQVISSRENKTNRTFSHFMREALPLSFAGCQIAAIVKNKTKQNTTNNQTKKRSLLPRTPALHPQSTWHFWVLLLIGMSYRAPKSSRIKRYLMWQDIAWAGGKQNWRRYLLSIMPCVWGKARREWGQAAWQNGDEHHTWLHVSGFSSLAMNTVQTWLKAILSFWRFSEQCSWMWVCHGEFSHAFWN